MTEKMIELADKAQLAAYKYWQEYQKTFGHAAVVWLKNNETGHLLIFTRGEYSEQLLAAIPKDHAELSNAIIENANKISIIETDLWNINLELRKAGLKPWEYKMFAECVAALRGRAEQNTNKKIA